MCRKEKTQHQHKQRSEEENNNINLEWYKIFEGTAHYYQINFNTSKIVAQTSYFNDILSRYMQAKSITGNDNVLSYSSMKEKSKSYQPEDISTITKVLEEIN